MISSPYTIPALGVLCVAGAVWVGGAMRAPIDPDLGGGEESAYDPRVPENLELAGSVPTMEEVLEKHLFVKERKATGANTFPDLLIKGTYVGEMQSVVLSLKSRPEINLRVWLDDVQSVIDHITDPRDPRKTIVDFLNEWDLKEITFKGVTVEHFVTGETETYEVDYTPTKHVKDNAAAGYGQGRLAEISPGGSKSVKKNTKPTAPKVPSAAQQRAQAMGQLRNMVQNMSPEQRERFAERIKGGQDRQQGGGGNTQNNNTNNRGSSNNRSRSR